MGQLESGLLGLTTSTTTTSASTCRQLPALRLATAVSRLGGAVPLRTVAPFAAILGTATRSIPRRIVLPVLIVRVYASTSVLLRRPMVDVHL